MHIRRRATLVEVEKRGGNVKRKGISPWSNHRRRSRPKLYSLHKRLPRHVIPAVIAHRWRERLTRQHQPLPQPKRWNGRLDPEGLWSARLALDAKGGSAPLISIVPETIAHLVKADLELTADWSIVRHTIEKYHKLDMSQSLHCPGDGLAQMWKRWLSSRTVRRR